MPVIEEPKLRNHSRVFRDRVYAGEVLAEMLESFHNSTARVFGIPAGGVPVAAVIARKLVLPLDVAVVSKITLPWNTEAGFGAVSYNGVVRLNETLIPQLGLTDTQIQQGIEKTTTKVMRRVSKLRGNQPFPELSQQSVILVDDGLASGFTMRVAVESLNKQGAEHIIVAVPTGHDSSVGKLAAEVKAVYCPNIREGWSYAVADAYQHWSDVNEDEVVNILETF